MHTCELTAGATACTRPMQEQLNSNPHMEIRDGCNILLLASEPLAIESC